MKHLMIFISFLMLMPQGGFAQDHNIHRVSYIFNPNNNAKQDISDAVRQASLAHKHIFVVVGGDWSLWCRNLITFFARPEVKQYMDRNNIIVPVNFSPENRNTELLDSYSCPKDRGYPIVIILDEHGNKVHMQDLDEYKVISKGYTGYSNEALFASVQHWSVASTAQMPVH